MAEILNVIYENIFLDCSYGFRTNRDCHKAIKKLDEIIMKKKINYVVDADIKGFFKNVNHKWVIKFLEHTIQDKKFIRYINRFLKCGILEDMQHIESDKGTPQGGLISPILANVYLHYKKYCIYFDEIAEKILKNVPEQNKKYVQKQLDQLEKNLWITYIIGMRSIIEMAL